MKTNTLSATSEKQAAKIIQVQFATDTDVRIEVRTLTPISWVPRRPSVPQREFRPALALAVTLLMACFSGLFVNPAHAALTNSSTDLAVLVVTATTNDAALPAIRQALDFLGTPYTVHIASAQPGALTADKLSLGLRGFYSSVMLTDSQLAYSPDGVSWTSALSTAEWATLNQFSADFAVRQINWSGYPTPDSGFNWPTAAFDST
ncbi:MAG: hypothetical protein HZA92_16250, partial [Verrucomicrobia bacterium]|nr:hypothetical protein [Verrucomicrobiota bacterium]